VGIVGGGLRALVRELVALEEIDADLVVVVDLVVVQSEREHGDTRLPRRGLSGPARSIGRASSPRGACDA
jgi:hypothetical protein